MLRLGIRPILAGSFPCSIDVAHKRHAPPIPPCHHVLIGSRSLYEAHLQRIRDFFPRCEFFSSLFNAQKENMELQGASFRQTMSTRHGGHPACPTGGVSCDRESPLGWMCHPDQRSSRSGDSADRDIIPDSNIQILFFFLQRSRDFLSWNGGLY